MVKVGRTSRRRGSLFDPGVRDGKVSTKEKKKACGLDPGFSSGKGEMIDRRSDPPAIGEAT